MGIGVGAIPLVGIGATIAAILTVLVSLACATWLIGKGSRHHKLWLRSAGALIGSVGMITGLGLFVNARMEFYPTVGAVVRSAREAISDTISGTTNTPTQIATPTPHTPSRIKNQLSGNWDRAPYRATFVPVKGAKVPGRLEVAQLTGPTSSVKLPVQVWLPPGYSRATTAQKYRVVVVLHGDPGTFGSVAKLLQLGQQVSALEAKNAIPPTIFVIPELLQDGRAPDCVDIAGRPRIGTWIDTDVPRIVAANFPQVSLHASDWAILGVSSGAYCAAHMALTQPQTYGAAIALSGYDPPLLGGLSRLPEEQRAEQSLSRLALARAHNPVRMFVGYSATDTDSLRLAQALSALPARAREKISVYDEHGGHNWKTWRQALAPALLWWAGAGGGASSPGSNKGADAARSGATGKIDLSQGVRKNLTRVESVENAPLLQTASSTGRGFFGPQQPWSIMLVGALALVVWAVPVWYGGGEAPVTDTAGRGSVKITAARGAIVTVASVLTTVTALLVVNLNLGFFTSWSGMFAALWG